MLHGDRQDQWECHIQPNWLLIWKQKGNELELLMLNTGTHSDLFGKTGGSIYNWRGGVRVSETSVNAGREAEAEDVGANSRANSPTP